SQLLSNGTDRQEAVASLAPASSNASQPRMALVPMHSLGSTSDPPWSVYDLHTDLLGSVRAETNGGGQLSGRHDFFPFGEEIAPMWSYNTHQFTGHERDSQTSLDYMKARYIDSTHARFLASDPVGGRPGHPQSWNRFAYGDNAPTTKT